MSFQLYVGNIPLDFSKRDVAEIFRDFDGIQVQKFFKREQKCYSFLLSKDINQVVSVIKQKNNVFVSGRKLVVRASDVKVQEYVELLLRESDKNETSPKSFDDADKTERVNKSHVSRYEEFPEEKSSVDSPPFIPLQVLHKPSKFRNARVKDPVDQYDKNSCHSSSSSAGNHFDKHCNDDESKSETASLKSSYYSLDQQDDDISDLAWVSVTNFPLRTTKRSLYQLFSDYDPVDVRMICNEARRDKTITEAHVCFLNQEIVDDVILNFDNTMFHGRILLVNDIQDLTVMNELLNVLHL